MPRIRPEITLALSTMLIKPHAFPSLVAATSSPKECPPGAF